MHAYITPYLGIWLKKIHVSFARLQGSLMHPEQPYSLAEIKQIPKAEETIQI
jgi:hypothetical protein